MLLVLWWCVREESMVGDGKKLLFCTAVAVISGLQNAYYSAMFLQLLLWAALFWFLRPGSRNRALWPIGLAGLLLLIIVFANFHTFSSWVRLGLQLSDVADPYGKGELYALRPVEFFVPRSHSF